MTRIGISVPAFRNRGRAVSLAICLGVTLAIGVASPAAAADLYVLGGGGGGGGNDSFGSGLSYGGGGAGGYVGDADKPDVKGGDGFTGGGSGSGGSGGGNSGGNGTPDNYGNGGKGSGNDGSDGSPGSGLNGGAGGGAVATVGDATYAAVAIHGGGGGAGGGSFAGRGGGGGEASLKAGVLHITGTFSLHGGNSGMSYNTNANGGTGGAAKFTGVSVNANELVMAGGDGGYSLGNSVAGGASEFFVTQTVTVEGALSVTGGNGGEGAARNGTGGSGGDAVFVANSTVTAAGSLSVASGTKGSNSFGGTGGAGGAASFTAASLSAPVINLTKKDGALAFKVGMLNVTSDNKIILTNTAAWDSGTKTGVAINGLTFAGGKKLTVSGTGTMTFGGNLLVAGAGNELNSPIAFNASGKALSFDLTGVNNNGVMLNATGGSANVTVNNTSVIALSGVSLLTLNDTVTLINGVTGSATLGSPQTLGRREFTVKQPGDSVLITATVTALQSFTDAQRNGLGNLSTTNLANGTAYLDWLEAGGSGIDLILMGQLETSWQNALDLGGVAAATAVRQFYGEQAVYANSSLSATAASFNALWSGQASAFVDQSLVASLHPSAVGVASPDAYASPADPACATASRIWGRGFGSWAKQDAQGGLSGYKYDAQGFALGYEHVLNNRLVLGLAAAYSKGDLKVNDLGYRNRPDVMNLALYGVYTHESGLYLQGGLGYGHAWNDYSTTMLVGGRKSGTYGSDTFSANLELGYAARLPGAFVLIPSVGVDYAHLRNSGWSESVSGNPALIANRFESDRDTSVALPVGVRLNRVFAFGANGGCIIPELRASWAYQAKQSRPSLNSGFVGAPGSFAQYGIEPGRNYWRLGASVGGRFNRRVDYRVDYDFDARSGFRGHSLMATLGVAF